MNIRFVIRTFLNLQRFEVFLAVLLPFFLIVESAAANAWAYAGGHFDAADVRTYIAIGRGLFFEVLTYSAAKLARLLARKGWQRYWPGALITAFVALWAIVVSAGNNLGWVLSGGDLGGMLASVSRYLPSPIAFVYQVGLGLLLPLSVGALALVDVEHLVHEVLSTAHLDNKAVQVFEAEMHRGVYLKSQKKQQKVIQQAYDDICGTRTQAFINRVKSGDMSFGSEDVARLPGGASVRSALPAPAARPLPAAPLPQTGPVLQGQVFPPRPASMGNPIPLPVPPGSPHH